MQEIKKLGVITSHPVQYYAPIFKLLHQRGKIEIKVFYTWGENSQKKHDPGFNKVVEWDLPLLHGYPYEWSVNTASIPGSHHFRGIKTPGLIRQVSNFNPDAILVFGWAYQSHLQLIWHFRNKVPLYFRGDSTLLDESGSIKKLFRNLFLSFVYSRIQHAFFTGSRNKEYFMKHGLKEGQLSFAPHAVDNERFAGDRSLEAERLRKRLGINPDETLILFAGKLEAKKAPMLLLNAFLELDNHNAHLLFAGNGDQETLLKSQILNLKSQISHIKSQKVHFMDFQNQTQMPVVYQTCDLFCLPSKGPAESWGLSINEAMACGKAILASDKVGAAIDLVIPNENGLIFEAGDLTDLKEKLRQLISNKNLLADYGKRSKEIIKDWNFVSIAKAIETQLNNEPPG